MTEKEEYWSDCGLFHGLASGLMGTAMDFIVCGEPREKVSVVWKNLCSRAADLDACLNRFKPESEVSIFNALLDGAEMECSEELFSLLDLAMEFNRRTEGLFDVTKGNAQKLSLESGRVLKKNGGDLSLDFGGIAKGYFLRIVRDRLKSEGMANAFVNFGNSSILALGHHPHGDCWKVSLEFDSTEEFSLKDSSLSSSGNSEGYCGSIINPFTGERMTDSLIRVIESPDPLDAEVLSTVFCLADEEQRERISEKFDIINFYTYDRGKRN